jgi:hypothetical protein
MLPNTLNTRMIATIIATPEPNRRDRSFCGLWGESVDNTTLNTVKEIAGFITALSSLIAGLIAIVKAVKPAPASAPGASPAPSTVSAPTTDQIPRFWTRVLRVLFAQRLLLAIVLTGGLTVLVVLGIQQLTKPAEFPHVEVSWLDKPFISKADVPSPVPVQALSKIAGKVQPAKNQLHLWLMVCNEEKRHCTVKRLQVFDSGEWEDSLRINRADGPCAVFEAKFALLDASGDFALRQKITTGVALQDIPEQSMRDAEVFVIQLVDDVETSCEAGAES